MIHYIIIIIKWINKMSDEMEEKYFMKTKINLSICLFNIMFHFLWTSADNDLEKCLATIFLIHFEIMFIIEQLIMCIKVPKN